MGVTERLEKQLKSRSSRPYSIWLTPGLFEQLLLEMLPHQRYFSPSYSGLAHVYFMGIPVFMECRKEFCRSCGAPIQPNECDYCGSETEVMTLQECPK